MASTQLYKVELRSIPASGAKRTMWRGGRQFEIKVPQVLELTKEEAEVYKDDKRFKLSKASKATSEPNQTDQTGGGEEGTPGEGAEGAEANGSPGGSDSQDTTGDDTKEGSDDAPTPENQVDDRLKKLLQKKRAKLDKIASELKIENPDKMGSKEEVAQAIIEAESKATS